MPGDRRHLHQLADVEEFVAAGVHLDRTEWVDTVKRALPAEEPSERVDHRLTRVGVAEGAEHGHTHALGVEAECVPTDGRRLDHSVAGLPDPAEPVDDEVVADVVPAAGVDMERSDSPQERRDVRLGVVVVVDGVMNDSVAQADHRLTTGSGEARADRALDGLEPCDRGPVVALDDRESGNGRDGGEALGRRDRQRRRLGADAMNSQVGRVDPTDRCDAIGRGRRAQDRCAVFSAIGVVGAMAVVADHLDRWCPGRVEQRLDLRDRAVPNPEPAQTDAGEVLGVDLDRLVDPVAARRMR